MYICSTCTYIYIIVYIDVQWCVCVCVRVCLIANTKHLLLCKRLSFTTTIDFFNVHTCTYHVKFMYNMYNMYLTVEENLLAVFMTCGGCFSNTKLL